MLAVSATIWPSAGLRRLIQGYMPGPSTNPGLSSRLVIGGSTAAGQRGVPYESPLTASGKRLNSGSFCQATTARSRTELTRRTGSWRPEEPNYRQT